MVAHTPSLSPYLLTVTPFQTDSENCELSNQVLLKAIYALSYTMDGNARRLVDYRNLGSEELGSVYEALLEMHPVSTQMKMLPKGFGE